MNEFGGNWTKEKIDIFMKYVPAYLTIMHSMIKGKHYAKDWKLMFFDGFAGSGSIHLETGEGILESVATKILSLDDNKGFDLYRFVELDKTKATNLETLIAANFPNKVGKTRVYQEDFNVVVKKMVAFLQKETNYKTLMFVDPFGMQVNWSSLEAMKGLAIDMWILIPTGMGINRMLQNDGDISEKWLEKLQVFLGLSAQEIQDHFYKKENIQHLFGTEEKMIKERNAIELAHLLYKSRLKSIFDNVSDSYVMKNQNNSILYHFLLASNNSTAIKIANSIIGKGISKF
ncbi:three-Cys-motif partner protein TcmP [Hugenholtzia roseola]|uniref:three-Cys-motif partner protein TcmP n=1 Tax=Hugenholtzia roseola TaxID=1002 RepID=UPI0004149C71|nr:three-Cys-motif partner protein TcmP [Hugenholtzia roseola]